MTAAGSAAPPGDRVEILGLTHEALARALATEAPESFRAAQIERWIHERGIADFDAMTDLPRPLRLRLAERFAITFPAVSLQESSRDGTVKYVMRLADGAAIEAVYMPEFSESGEVEQATLCLSSQAGCPLACQFCVTGWAGAGRNLTAGEIAGQYLDIARRHDLFGKRVNVVMMGMGEPLLNLEALGPALDLIYRTTSPRRVTVSTAGVVPGIFEMAAWPVRPNLAISLNAPDDARRSEIMPINRKYPIATLLDAARRWPRDGGRRITFEYVLLAGYNDAPIDADLLAAVVRSVPCKVNIIPLNEDRHFLRTFLRPDEAAVSRFARRLAARGLIVTVRRSRGRDIAAACGQLMNRQKEAIAR